MKKIVSYSNPAVIGTVLIVNRRETPPQKAIIDGHADFIGADVGYMEYLHIKGDLYASSSKWERLPKTLIVDGNIIMTDADVKNPQAGEKLIVGGDADFTSASIKRLAKETKIGGDLMLEHSDIETSEGIKVGGYTYLAFTALERIEK